MKKIINGKKYDTETATDLAFRRGRGMSAPECRRCGFPADDDEQIRCRCCGALLAAIVAVLLTLAGCAAPPPAEPEATCTTDTECYELAIEAGWSEEDLP